MPSHKNRELAKNFRINLAKWKRWSREFLPPDPKAFMQAGYAREYSLDEAFRVYLGGYLVSYLGFSIPASQRILNDLDPWMREKGVYPSSENYIPMNKKGIVRGYTIFIEAMPPGFLFRIKEKIEKKSIQYRGLEAINEIYAQELIYPFGKRERISFPYNEGDPNVRVLDVDLIRISFLRELKEKENGAFLFERRSISVI